MDDDIPLSKIVVFRSFYRTHTSVFNVRHKQTRSLVTATKTLYGFKANVLRQQQRQKRTEQNGTDGESLRPGLFLLLPGV